MTSRDPLGLLVPLLVCAALGQDVPPQVAPTYLQAIIEGRGSPLVMLGGGTQGAAEFQPHAHLLAEEHRVIRLETINVERSRTREPLPRGYSIRTESAAMARTLDRLKIDMPVDLVGHGFGALVALDYALDHPHRIRTLTLMDPPAIWLVPPSERPESAEVGTIYDITGSSLSAVIEHTDDPDRLTELRRPVLIITASDTVASRRTNELLASHLPVVERVELKGGQSSSSTEQETFVSALDAFLAKHRFN